MCFKQVWPTACKQHLLSLEALLLGSSRDDFLVKGPPQTISVFWCQKTSRGMVEGKSSDVDLR